jgi:hypothetical protein
MVLFPATRLLPFNGNVAPDVPPDPETATDPSVTFPARNVTLPVGEVLPLVAATVTARRVEPLRMMLVGDATAAIVVPTVEEPTITFAVDNAPLKFPSGM